MPILNEDMKDNGEKKDRDHCVLEYSESQGAWHYNFGDYKIGSNGYMPMAQGEFTQVQNLAKIVHEREGSQRLTLKEAQDLVFKCLYDYSKMLPKVHYIIS